MSKQCCFDYDQNDVQVCKAIIFYEVLLLCFMMAKLLFLLTTETLKGKLHDCQHRTAFAISNIAVNYMYMYSSVNTTEVPCSHFYHYFPGFCQ